jgi:WD40 repeat protein
MKPVFTSKVDAEVMDLDISPNNDFIACGLFNGNLEILKTENGQTKFLIKLSKNSFSIPCVKWRNIKDENNIAAITADGNICSFNLNDYV